MSENRSSIEEFVIPQKSGAKKFRQLISGRVIRRIYLTTISGASIFDLPVDINLGMLLPKPFLLPIQAVVSVVSVFSRMANIRIILEVENEAC